MTKRVQLAGLALSFALSCALLSATGAGAADKVSPGGTLIDFRVDVQKSVANDLGRASAYAEMAGADPAELARRVNAQIAQGLAVAKGQPGVAVRTGNSQTTPIYAKNSRSIEAWRMRSELLLESRDAAALSDLLGKLQATLAVGQIGFTPSPETRRKAEDEGALEAIAAFQARAARLAGALKKTHRIKQMSVSGAGQYPVPMLRAMAADAAPMPVEAGESTLTVTVSGQIELNE